MIKIPTLFQSILSKNAELSACVEQTFSLFSPWLEQSGMPFFPGFTDHSPRHINEVLETASSLITDDSHALLSPEDVAILCIAILLHDCGMHLTHDGFRALIKNSDKPIISDFGDQEWSKLWDEFLGEAKRFSQEKLINVFGDNESIIIENINYENLSERDNLLIGEFVRRHHARLAHEIAIEGVPNLSGKKLKIIGIDEDLRDIAGLIARSHGLAIRDTFSYLETNYSLVREYRKVKTPYLMAVLRISDYVQVHSERALKSLLSVKELRSPFSRQEWRNHFAVRGISHYHDDPDAYFVNATPGDVKTYIKLTSLFKDIQRELDESWATIGEVYGRIQGLSKLGLSIRRIRSNLDSPANFAKTVSYLPIKAGFDTSGIDLLKLLVGPLYDYKPQIGIRELIQNAVDACKELHDISKTHNNDHDTSQNLEVKVQIDENDDGTGWLTISDNGIGMTVETITNYFLIAGASFRNSDLWKQQHTNESGQSRVLRGGRFGVGALASFLLGDEIEVTTRAYNQSNSEGVTFSARIDEPIVELRRCQAESGTTIKVWISKTEIIDQLRPFLHESKETPHINELQNWEAADWYVQSTPKVECRWSGFNQRVKDEYYTPRFRVQGIFLPKIEIDIKEPGESAVGWQKIEDSKQYKAIYWKFIPKEKRTDGRSSWLVQPAERITVNGIRVQTLQNDFLKFDSRGNQYKRLHYSIRRPSMAIFDQAGICPINLQRSTVSFESMGFDAIMAKAIIKKHFKDIKKTLHSAYTTNDFYDFCINLPDSRDVVYDGITSCYFATSKGILIASPDTFRKLNISRIFFIYCPNNKSMKSANFDKILKADEALVFRHAPAGTQTNLSWFRGLLDKRYDIGWAARNAKFPLTKTDASILVMPEAAWDFANVKKRVNADILKLLKKTVLDDNYVSASSGNIVIASDLLNRCRELMTIFGDNPEIGCWSLSDNQPYLSETSLFTDIWGEEYKSMLLPFKS
jgi:molecular chaperone HtpG